MSHKIVKWVLSFTLNEASLIEKSNRSIKIVWNDDNINIDLRWFEWKLLHFDPNFDGVFIARQISISGSREHRNE